MAKAADQFRSVGLVKDFKDEDDKVLKVSEVAQHIFWEVVSLNYKDVKSGDFPPDLSAEFNKKVEEVIKEWLSINK